MNINKNKKYTIPNLKDKGKSYKDYLRESLIRDNIPLERYKSLLGGKPEDYIIK